ELAGYGVWREGELVGEPTDVRDLWRDDLVAFLVGCSFTFDSVLTRAGLPWRYPGRNVAMYETDRPCRSAGRVHGPLVVSMRPVPAELVDTAVRITTLMPASHGGPVQIRSPEKLGVADPDEPHL